MRYLKDGAQHILCDMNLEEFKSLCFVVKFGANLLTKMRDEGGLSNNLLPKVQGITDFAAELACQTEMQATLRLLEDDPRGGNT